MARCIAIATALLCACGADLIEPNPPKLARTRSEYRASSVAEPAVWLVISDIYLEHDEDCASAVAWLESVVRAAIPSTAAGTLELAPIQVSPCTQPNTRTIDAPAIDAALRDAASRFPGKAVRPLLIYANNILLNVPGQIATALQSIDQLSVNRGALTPRLWVLLARNISIPSADRVLNWTYSGDPAIAQQLAQTAADELPFMSDSDVVSPALPLFASGPPGVRSFKVCAMDEGVQAVDFAADGTAVTYDVAHPPHYRVTLHARFAVPHGQFQPLSAGIETEACFDHCDRYLGDNPPVRWLARSGCLSGSAS
jgi:hypothetical protein